MTSATERTKANSLKRRQMWWRLAWAVVLLLHAPLTFKAFSGLWRLGSGDVGWSSLLLLTISNAFFILEILFARCQRIITNRRAMVVLLLIVALVHVGVIDRAAPGLLAQADVHRFLLLAGLGVVGLDRILRIVAARSMEIALDWREALRQLSRLFYHRLHQGRALRPAPITLRAGPALRAPPHFIR
jgi:hypothetical protein